MLLDPPRCDENFHRIEQAAIVTEEDMMLAETMMEVWFQCIDCRELFSIL